MEKSVIISKYIQELKNELFQEIHEMFKHRNRPTSKRWLKSNEVVKLLEFPIVRFKKCVPKVPYRTPK